MQLFGKANLCALIFFISVAYADDKITVYNKSPRDIYVAIYYADDERGNRTTPIQFIEASATATMQRPERKYKGISFSGVFYDRELVFVEDSSALKDTLTRAELNQYHSLNIGSLKGSTFYIASQDTVLVGYNRIEWMLIKEILEDTIIKTISKLFALYTNPYHKTTAHVRIGNQLCEQEKEYTVKRRAFVKQALEKLLDRPLDDDYIPSIAIICSGGGFRSMLYTTGCLRGAQEAGLLDATMYTVGLSGSAWAIGAWHSINMPIIPFHDWLVGQLKKGVTSVSFEQARWIAGMLLTKYYNDQPLNIVDLYGALLANGLFSSLGKRVQHVHLSEQAERIKEGTLPLPIYTAVAAESVAAENLWYEFTPYEIGAAWLQMYVPSWAFGRKFKFGKSVDFAPEQSFGFLMGTFGLAVGITIKRLVQEAQLREKMPIKAAASLLDELVRRAGTARPIASLVHNFSYEILNSKYTSMFKRHHMSMVDAAISFNLPYPPISGDRPERKADIIIICDANNQDLERELKAMSSYATNHGYPIPEIDYTRAVKKAINVFKDPVHSEAPVIIYLPRIVDTQLIDQFKDDPRVAQYVPSLINFDIEKCIQGTCHTFNFNYSKQDATSMSMLGAFNMRVATEQIKDAIEWVMERHSSS